MPMAVTEPVVDATALERDGRGRGVAPVGVSNGVCLVRIGGANLLGWGGRRGGL